MNSSDIKKDIKVDKVKRKFPWLKVIIGVVIALVLAGIGYFIYKTYKAGKDIGFSITPESILNIQKDPELKKDSTGKYTNVMLVGIDTREENAKLLNTDTIIVASYNYDTNNVVMISVPRDFHVQVNENVVWYNRINSVYSAHESKKEGSGLSSLQNVVEDITGLEIQYHAMIDYKGFVQLIDAVGGVYVNVENSFTDYMYPQGNGYKTVSFKTGPQLMNGSTALEYSRSRHSNDNGEGSDFMRARRQQKVILAFKDVLLSSDTFLNPTKITSLISAIQNNIQVSEFTIEDIQAAIKILKTYDEKNGSSYSFVLDTSAGNSSLLTSKDVVNTGAYAIGPIEGLGKYTNIREYVSLLMKDPLIYSTDPSIYAYNTGLGYQEAYNKVKALREKYKYLNIKYYGTLYSNKENSYIYAHDKDFSTQIVDQLATDLETENKSKPSFVTTNLKNEDITILFGKKVTTQTNTSE